MEDYLLHLVQEMTTLQEHVRHQETMLTIKFNAFLCDAPARGFVKCIKGHNAYQGCEWCEAPAKQVDCRIVYTYPGSYEK